MADQAVRMSETIFEAAAIAPDGRPLGFEPVHGFSLGVLAIHQYRDPQSPQGEAWGVYHAKTGIQILHYPDMQTAAYVAHQLGRKLDWSGVHRGPDSAHPVGFTRQLKKKIVELGSKLAASKPEISMGHPREVPTDLPEIAFEIVVQDDGQPPRYRSTTGFKVGVLAVHRESDDSSWRISHIDTGLKVLEADDKGMAVWMAQVANEAVDWGQIRRGPDPGKPLGVTPGMLDRIWAAFSDKKHGRQGH